MGSGFTVSEKGRFKYGKRKDKNEFCDVGTRIGEIPMSSWFKNALSLYLGKEM